MADLKYKEIIEKVIGAAMKVHAALGNGFQKIIYQRAIEIELREVNVFFERELNMLFYYKSQQIGERRVDFLIEGKNSVELKAIITLESVHFAQVRNYLEAYNLEVGLLLNFGSVSLQFKRLQNPKFLFPPFPFNQ